MMRASGRVGRFVALVFALASASSTVRAAPPFQQPPLQQPPLQQPPGPPPLLFSQRGLDPKNNRIDALISMFGFLCSSKNPLRRCRIEIELESLLRSFPPDQSVILQELRALGATCRGDDRRLACVVERTVETTGWAAGHEPRVIKSRILIGLLVEDVNGTLKYSASYDITEQQKSNDQ